MRVKDPLSTATPTAHLPELGRLEPRDARELPHWRRRRHGPGDDVRVVAPHPRRQHAAVAAAERDDGAGAVGGEGGWGGVG